MPGTCHGFLSTHPLALLLLSTLPLPFAKFDKELVEVLELHNAIVFDHWTPGDCECGTQFLHSLLVLPAETNDG